MPSHAASEWLDLPSFIVILFSNYDLPSVKLEEREIELGFGPWPKEGRVTLVECPLMWLKGHRWTTVANSFLI